MTVEQREEKGRGEEWGWTTYAYSAPVCHYHRQVTWLQSTAPISQPSPSYSNCSRFLLLQFPLAHVVSPRLLHSSFWFPYSLTTSLQIFPLLESLQMIPDCVASISCWDLNSLVIQTVGKDGDCVAWDGYWSYCLCLNHHPATSFPGPKGTVWHPLTLPWDKQMDNKDIQTEPWKHSEMEFLTGSHREKGKPVSGRKQDFVMST